MKFQTTFLNYFFINSCFLFQSTVMEISGMTENIGINSNTPTPNVNVRTKDDSWGWDLDGDGDGDFDRILNQLRRNISRYHHPNLEPDLTIMSRAPKIFIAKVHQTGSRRRRRHRHRSKQNLETFPYDTATGVNLDLVDFEFDFDGLKNRTIIASLNESYLVQCIADYVVQVQVDFPVSRKDFMKQYRDVLVHNLVTNFNTKSNKLEMLLLFNTKSTTIGSVICKSVHQPRMITKLHIFTEDPSRSTTTNTAINYNFNGYNMPESNISKRSVQNINSSQMKKRTENQTLELEFSSRTGKIYCRHSDSRANNNNEGKLTNVSLILVSCSSPYHCDLYHNCFRSNCDLDVIRVQNKIGCDEINEMKDCRTTSADRGSYQTGLAQCQAGTDVITEHYFTGFDKRTYTLSQEIIPNRALIYMEEIGTVLRTNKPIFLFCAAINFLFTDNIQFSVIYKNRTQNFVPKELSLPATKEDLDVRATRETVQAGMYLNVTDDMIEIVCMAPWFNSTDWLTTSRKVTVENDPCSYSYEFEREMSSSIVTTIIILAIVAVSTGLLLLWKKYETTKNRKRNLTREEVDEFENGNAEALLLAESTSGIFDGNQVNPENVHLLPFNRDYIINPIDCFVDRSIVLGKGTYGIVFGGKFLGDTVAVKTTQPYADVNYFKALLSEVKAMTYIGKHEHVINFFGAVTKNIMHRVVYVVVECSPYGNLSSFLKANQSTFLSLYDKDNNKDLEAYENEPGLLCMSTIERVTTHDLLTWSYQIASGMDYLAKIKVIHGDLCTRNILLFYGYVAKITDFGLSRQLYESMSYVKKQQSPLPWRWMALESLRNLEFSTQSDVWSFGVSIWEMFSMGETPFAGENYDLEFIARVHDGHRLNKPEFSKGIYEDVMLKCWSPEPRSRPSFEYLKNYFMHRMVTSSFDRPINLLSGKSN